ncbi:MAG: PAS domain-containing protein [Bacteroidota bacterium]
METLTPSLQAPRSLQVAPFWKRFQALMHTQPALVLDAEGNVRYVTTSARILMEYGADQAMEPCFFSLIHGRNLYQVMRDVADMVSGRKRETSWLLRLRTGRGRWRWYRVTASNHLDQEPGYITLQMRAG